MNVNKVKSIPLLLVLLTPFISLILIAAGLIWSLSFYSAKHSINDLAVRLRYEINRRIEDHIHAYLDTPHRINQANADAIRKGLLDAENQTDLEMHFLDQIKNNESITSISFGNTSGGLANAGREGSDGSLYIIGTDNFKKGIFRKYTVDDEGGKVKETAAVPAFDAAERTWYKKAAEERRAVWSDPYVLFTGQDMSISASRPVYDSDNTLLGVVVVDIFFSQLSDFLKTLDIGKTGQSFIIDTSGLLIASSTGEKPFRETGGEIKWKQISAAESPDLLTKSAAEALINQFEKYQLINVSQQFDFSLDRHKQLGHVSLVRNKYGLDWLIVTVIPETNFMSKIYLNNWFSFFITLLIAFSIILTGAIITRKIVRQVQRINTCAIAVANGEMSKIIDYHSRISEIGSLTRAFNYMTDQLKQMIDRLNHEIKTRKESEDNLRNLFNAIDDFLFVLNEKGEIIWCNQTAVNKLGYSENELSGQSVLFVHPPEFREEAGRIVAAMLAEESDYGPMPLMTRDGERIPVETCVFRGKWSGKDVIFGVSRDLSDLKASEEKFSKAFHASSSLMAITENDTGCFIDVNKTFLDKLGYKLDEIIGHTPEELGFFVDKTQKNDAMNIIGKEGRLLNHEVLIQTKSGTVLHGLFSAEYIRLQDKTLLLTIMNDITELKNLQQQVIRQERLAAAGQLSAGLAHDFNNILTSVMGNVELMQTSPETPDSMKNSLQDVYNSSIRAVNLVKQILDFSQKSIRKPQNIDLSALVSKTVKYLESEMPEDIRITLASEPGSHMIDADPVQIERLIMNLAHNARDSMSTAGDLRIELKPVIINESIKCVLCDHYFNGNWIKLSVADNGSGIPEKIMPHLFEPFFTNKEIGKGSGLGLPQVLGIVNHHNGHLTISSRPYKGTIVDVYFPVVQKNGESGLENYLPVNNMEKKILLVEDDPGVRNVNKKMIERNNFTVLTAAGAVEAIKIYKEHFKDIALVLSDMVLPDFNGAVLYHRLKEINTDIKMIVISGYPVDDQGIELLEQGVLSWEQKPLSLSRLSKLLKEAVTGSAGRWG